MARRKRDGKGARPAGDLKDVHHLFKLHLMSAPLPPAAPPAARATALQPAPRFERLARLPEADGWDIPDDPRPVQREVAIERPRSAISRNASPDLGFDRSVNPYRGCEHGCIFCYARPTHAYLGLSPGLDFETRLIARPDAPAVLAAELRKPGYRAAPLALGTNTDCWQPVEAKFRIARGLLQVLSDFAHPVTIATRSALIERDLDLLAPMAARGLVEVGISIGTLDAGLARAMEPRAPAPARRLKVIERLAAAGVPVRVLAAPIIPGLTDHELESILTAARDAGARAAWWSLVRLPLEVEPLMREWLERNRPERAARVLNRIAVHKGGRLNTSEWFTRFRGEGPEAALVARRAEIARRRLGLDNRLPPLRCDLFRPPPRPGDQLSLF
jgi:DNA repair photolyase